MLQLSMPHAFGLGTGALAFCASSVPHRDENIGAVGVDHVQTVPDTQRLEDPFRMPRRYQAQMYMDRSLTTQNRTTHVQNSYGYRCCAMLSSTLNCCATTVRRAPRLHPVYLLQRADSEGEQKCTSPYPASCR